ncbi:MAG TPA: hypothetical protein VM536_23310 [Chloroflexia bacterium]|nr:hypothetical protein [Chloroflexia bacterium]
MFVVCPDCGAADQEVGKYCENCGRLLTEADAQAGATATPAAPAPAAPWVTPDPGAAPAAGSFQFAVVRNRTANPAEGFSLPHAGEFLVGRPNVEAGTGVDVDVRQWVQPLEYQGQKQYLVHRSQCFLGVGTDGVLTIRACPGAESDTLLRPAAGGTFVPLAQFATVRPLRPDNSYPLERGDQIFMGDPSAVAYYETGDPTAQGTYLVLELQ